MSWKRKTLRYTLDVILLIVVVAGGVFLYVTRTRSGSERVVTEVLRRLQDAMNGEIIVERVTSSRVLEGVTLQGVRIRGPRGDLFFSADSVRLEYSPRTFLSGDVVLSRMAVWSGTVVIRKEPGEQEFNVDRVLREGEDDSGPSRTILFRNVTLHQSQVFVYYPVPEGQTPGAREVVVPTEDGEGLLRRLAFRRIEASLPEAIISSEETPGPQVEVAGLSLLGRIYEDPFRVMDFQGHVGWAESRLRVEFSELELPNTRARGQVVVDFTPEEGPAVSVRLQAPELALADLQWIEPRLPAGEGRGEIELHIGAEGRRWRFAELDLRIEESRVAGEGVILEGGPRGLVFEDVAVQLSPLALWRIEPFLSEPLPVEGTLRGQASLNGTLDRLRTRGRLTLDPPDRPASTADFAGILHLQRPFGATDLEATLDPFDFALAARFFPALAIRGPGRVELEATGRLGEGVRFTADVVHRPANLPRSHVVATGSVRQRGEELVLDLTSDVQPLSFTALRTYWPSIPVSGEVSGRIVTQGPLSNLTVTTDLDTEAGELDVVARLNARNPQAFYTVEGEVANFRLSAIVPELPEPTVVNGYLFLEGSGTEASTLRLTGRLRARDSRVGNLFVDTAYAAVRIAGGVLSLDTLDAVAGGVRVDAQGTLAVAEGEPSGEIRVAFQSDSLAPLRPLLFGEDILTQDGLTPIDRQVYEMRGIDPDTLPTEEQVAVGGAVDGEVVLRGSVRDFSAEGRATFEEVRYGTSYVRNAEVVFAAEHLPSLEGDVRAQVEADSLEILDRGFSRAEIEITYRESAGQRPGGELDLFLQRHEDEDYRAVATFAVDTAGSVVHLDQMTLRFDTLRWELVEPASVAWTGEGITVENLRMARPGGGGLSLFAEGRLPFDGPADFTLQVQDLDIGRLARLIQADTAIYGGMLDLDVRITGQAEAPVMTGTVSATDVRYQDFTLGRVVGEFDYADRRIALDLEAWRDSLRVLVAQGTVPVDLSFQGVSNRIPDAPIDLDVVADSFPAALALSFFGAFEDVEGTVAGEFHIGGTVEDVSPSGTLRLQNAAVTYPALGVRHRDLQGTLALSPDGTVQVDARARSGEGTGVVRGRVTLAPLTDPTFDSLRITLRRFEAVDRSDVEGTVSGEMLLTGTYSRPFLEGALTVDEGVLYVEEFQRSAQVVDLSDPAFFDVVDTTLISARPILEGAQNPFLSNLRMDVDLQVERDTWLRSQDMNVEIGGELLVTYDRQQGDLVLVGELEAIRGSYTLFGRRFVVQEGQVEFVGTPGINPNLGIEATNRLRQIDGDPLTISAIVSGTLNNPRVSLTSEAGVAESDLVSYLIFGRPSYELASGEAAIVEGAAGRLVGAAAGAGLTLGLGTLANRLGTLLGQEFQGVDYVAITQTQDLTLGGLGLASTLAGTQVELGWYLDEDLFVLLVLQPLADVGQASGNWWAGVRLEWTATDTYTLEAFWEDRFLRRRTFGFGQLGFQTSKVLGFSFFREWGY